MRRFRKFLAWGLLACLLHTTGAWAGHKSIDIGNLDKVQDFAPGGFGESFDMKVVAEMVYNPGMSDKRGCRLQVYMTNSSLVTVNVRVPVVTYDQNNNLADINLVPSGRLLPGQQVMRLYSCTPAAYVDLPRDNQFSWPNTCDIDGTEQTPCPIAIHFSTTLDKYDPSIAPKVETKPDEK